jgi:TetR/AcrR family transcriptional regulator
MTLSKKKKAPQKEKHFSDDTRQRILVEARKLFGKQGYSKTSTRAIAKAAQCNISLIAYYFGGKEGLLDAVAKNVAAGVGAQFQNISQQHLNPTEVLKKLIPFVVDYLSANSDFLSILFKVYIAENKPLPPLFLSQIEENANALTALLTGAQRDGSIHPSLNPRISASLLMGMALFHFLAAPLATKISGPNTPEKRELLKQHIASIFLEGILKPTRSGEKRS